MQQSLHNTSVEHDWKHFPYNYDRCTHSLIPFVCLAYKTTVAVPTTYCSYNISMLRMVYQEMVHVHYSVSQLVCYGNGSMHAFLSFSFFLCVVVDVLVVLDDFHTDRFYCCIRDCYFLQGDLLNRIPFGPAMQRKLTFTNKLEIPPALSWLPELLQTQSSQLIRSQGEW